MVEFSSIFDGFDEVCHCLFHFRTQESAIFETDAEISLI